MKDLSYRQEAILRYCRDFIRLNDYSPSIRDIQDGCDISSTSVVDYNLKALERSGQITRERGLTRTIAIVNRRRYVRVPIIGTISAGQPISYSTARERERMP